MYPPPHNHWGGCWAYLKFFRRYVIDQDWSVDITQGSYPVLAEDLGFGSWLLYLMIIGGLVSTMGRPLTCLMMIYYYYYNNGLR
jgi:hypothetical protein